LQMTVSITNAAEKPSGNARHGVPRAAALSIRGGLAVCSVAGLW